MEFMEKIPQDAELDESTPANNRPEQLIYIGPNLPGGALQRYTVFKGGIPLHVAEITENCPEIKGMFVPVNELSAAEQAMRTAGTVENTLFDVVVDYTRGGK